MVPSHSSPLGVEMVVYERLRVSIPSSALSRRVVLDNSLGPLDLSDVQGLSSGLPIEGPDDPRLEVRQWLVDCLVAH